MDGSITILEQYDSEDGSDDGDYELNIGGLGETNCVQEVSSQEQAQLVEPRHVVFLYILVVNRLNLGMHCLEVVLKSGLLVALVEVLDSLGVLLLNLSLSQMILVFKIFSDFLTLNTHDAHEVVSRVGQFWASVLISK